MKTRLTRKSRQLASALLVSLVICSILSLFVMYYLSLIEQQNILSGRSQTWNMAIAVSEAGVEDGLEQLNSCWPNLGTNGWSYDGSTCYSRSNALPEGNGYMSYIYVTNSANPVVVARAFVTPPNASFWETTWHTAMILFASQGQSANVQAPVTRAVQVTCSKGNLFLAALVAKQTINLNGNNINTDSYNSLDPSKSANGQYAPNKYKGDYGDIASNMGITDSIGAGNANVYGHAHTGPNSVNNALQIGPNGYIGSHANQLGGGTGVQSGWWMQDANFTFPDTTYPNTAGYFSPTGGVLAATIPVTSNYTFSSVSYPSPLPSGLQTNTALVTGAAMPPASGTYISGTLVSSEKHGVTTFSYTAINSYYWVSNATFTVMATNTYDHILYGTSDLQHTNYYTLSSALSGNTIVVGTNVVLALDSGINMSGQDTFTVAQGANITVYSAGTSVTVGGNGIVNQQPPIDFILYCAPSVTSFSLGGNGTFSGVVVAPNVNVTMNGGGNNSLDYSGCLMANSVTMNGHMNFHYDEALGNMGGNGRFLITAWNEIK